MAKKAWGNPEAKSYEKQSLRWAVYGENRVQVHKHVWRIVERLLQGMGSGDINVESARTLDEPLKLGFHLVVTEDELESISADLDLVKFGYQDGNFTFIGTVEEAVELSRLLEVEAPENLDHDSAFEQEAGLPVDESPKPWRSDDAEFIVFVQALLGAEKTGEMNEETSSRLKTWQGNHGVPTTGEIDAGTLATFVPRRAMWLRPGATGTPIKVMQAAFQTLGYFDAQINGVWGVKFSRALRKFQEDYRIHPRLRVGSYEWEALFDFSDAPSENLHDQQEDVTRVL
jgi:peptidoglycan hydrolase-like protein with peptidoglycan-binding domain